MGIWVAETLAPSIAIGGWLGAAGIRESQIREHHSWSFPARPILAADSPQRFDNEANIFRDGLVWRGSRPIPAARHFFAVALHGARSHRHDDDGANL